ncbi:MAG: HNH endonuclease signature motif containing protein [Xanthobacteraceae bacterium]
MSWGFEPGRVYNRRADIHARFGGQQQGGIVTPANHAAIIIITGEEGLEHGYGDRYRPDGIFEYFGEGQLGDMQLIRGNRALAEHSAAGKSLLLFRKTPEGVRFEGEMVCEGYHSEQAPDSEGNQRQAIVFELRPLDAIAEHVEAEPITDNAPLSELRVRAIASSASVAKAATTSTKNVYERSRDVRRYVLARSKGKCEGCSGPAPFSRPDGTPYLEPHHLKRLSDGGPDHPAHVIALCPNCHRRVHAGADGSSYNATLMGLMAALEPNG